MKNIPFTDRALQVIDKARWIAGPVSVGTHHLLLAIAEDSGVAASALRVFNVEPAELRHVVSKLIGPSDTQPSTVADSQLATVITFGSTFNCIE